jgi:hypothetical protein
LAEVAKYVGSSAAQDVEANHVALYAARLSIELALKSLLECACVPVPAIKSSRHDLAKLLNNVEQCEVKVLIAPDLWDWVSASRLRSIAISTEEGMASVAEIVEAESIGASRYPNELRYGSSLVDFPSVAVAQAAEKVVDWAFEHKSSIRIRLNDGERM